MKIDPFSILFYFPVIFYILYILFFVSCFSVLFYSSSFRIFFFFVKYSPLKVFHWINLYFSLKNNFEEKTNKHLNSYTVHTQHTHNYIRSHTQILWWEKIVQFSVAIIFKSLVSILYSICLGNLAFLGKNVLIRKKYSRKF